MKLPKLLNFIITKNQGGGELTRSPWAGQDRAEPAIVGNIWAQRKYLILKVGISFDNQSYNLVNLSFKSEEIFQLR